MNDQRKPPPASARSSPRPRVAKPPAPRTGPRVNPEDPVEEASNESFPASDPPAFSPSRAGPPRPAGENPEKRPGKR